MNLDSFAPPTEISPSPTPANVGAVPGASTWEEDLRPRVLVVQVGTNAFGIPVEQVRGVLRQESLTSVPGSPKLVSGIVNVRGVVVTVLELSVLLSAERAVTTPSIVLLEHGTRLIGISVDSVRDVRAHDAYGVAEATGHDRNHIELLDAVALCVPHLLSSEEMGL